MCQVCVQGVCSCSNSGHIVCVVLSSSLLVLCAVLLSLISSKDDLCKLAANDLQLLVMCVPIATRRNGGKIHLLVAEATFSPVTSPLGLCLNSFEMLLSATSR